MKTQQVTRVLEGITLLGQKSKIYSQNWKLNSNQGVLAKQSGFTVVKEAF